MKKFNRVSGICDYMINECAKHCNVTERLTIKNKEGRLRYQCVCAIVDNKRALNKILNRIDECLHSWIQKSENKYLLGIEFNY